MPEATATVRATLGVLRRRKVSVAMVTVLAAGLAVGLSLLHDPVYAASARLLLQPRMSESLFDQNAGARTDPARAVRNEIVVIESEPVRQAVHATVGGAPDAAAAPVGDTDAIQLTVEDKDPDRAARVANAYAAAYIAFRHKQVVDDLQSAGQEVQGKVDQIGKQIEALDTQVATVAEDQREARRTALAPQRQALVSTQALFRQQLDQIQVEIPLKSGGAQLIAEARPSSTPVRPRPVRDGALGLVLGLWAGVALAFVRDHLDDSITSKDDLAAAVGGRPVVGLIPLVASARRRRAGPGSAVVSLGEPSSPAAEAYRTLRTSVQFLGLERPVHTLMVTSPNAGEGKTTVVANLGVVLARAGFHVTIVDCDLRRPRVSDQLGLSNGRGFTSVLLGDVTIEDALQDVPGVDRLRVLASGPTPPNPSEILSLRRTSEVITHVGADGGFVLVDSPPVLAVTDAAVMSQKVDAVLLVCVAGVTTAKEAARAVELLEQVDAPLAGAILNGVTEEGGYGYAYSHRYHKDAAKR